MRFDELKIDPETLVTELGRPGSSAKWLRETLGRLEVGLRQESALGVALAQLEKTACAYRAEATLSFPSPAAAQEFYLQMTGADFLSKALHWGQASGLRGFDDHFNYLSSGDPVLTSPNGVPSLARNKTWELLLASVVATFAEDVRPGEPDVLCRFHGRTIGLAAKVLYSSNPAKLLDRLKEGTTQLENSDAETGFVAVNLVEQFPHGRMFNNFVNGRFNTGEKVCDLIGNWVTTFIDLDRVQQWARRLRGNKKILSVLFFVPTVVHMHGPIVPLLPYYRLHLVSIVGRDQEASPFEVALNQAFQCVLAYDVDVPESG